MNFRAASFLSIVGRKSSDDKRHGRHQNSNARLHLWQFHTVDLHYGWVGKVEA